MTSREEGFLLLTSSLGDTARKPLSVLQFRTLILRSKELPSMRNASTVTMEQMAAMGYDEAMAQRVVRLFGQRREMEAYLQKARQAECEPIALTNPDYPALSQLGWNIPGVFWAKGDRELLHKPAISLVGSRELGLENARFAQQVGRLAAKEGYVLISGNARGADTVAQDACLQHGGKVISIVADSLADKRAHKNILYLSEDSFDLPFSSRRALSRNRFIHCMGKMTFVAQSALGRGGTWSGTSQNLNHNWSPVYCFSDGSEAVAALCQRGAAQVSIRELSQRIR